MVIFMKNIIEIKNLNKRFGDIKAVNDLSFNVKEGELFAFLGVNGAGKSTTINILCGQLAKDSGTVTVGGVSTDNNLEQIKSEIGVVFQDCMLDKMLTVRDNLSSRAALYGITGKSLENRLNEISSLLDLSDLMKRKVSKLSGGQRRRVDIARALLHRPKLLVLDEPTTGLDPQTRKNLWSVIEKLRREENMTVLLTTHYMEEAAPSDYVVIIDSGKIVARGTPLELKNKYTGDFVTIYGINEEQAKAFSLPYTKVRDGYKISVSNTAQATELIIKNPRLFRDYEITKGGMDDVFLAVTGKKLGGEH